MPYHATIFTLTAIVAGALAATMLQAAELPGALAACRSKTSDTERLACYDALAGSDTEPSADGPSTPTTVAQIPVAPEGQDTASVSGNLSPEELFGLSGEEVKRTYDKAAGQQELKELSATVTDVQRAGHSRIIVWLDNGQVWRQTDYPTLKIKVGDRVIIRKAAFGSFKMKKEDANATMRVHREK